MERRRVLTIAGSDPCGGAGIQADVGVFGAFGCHGMAVIAAMTVQDSRGAAGVRGVEGAFVRAQIDALFEDCRPAAAKTGMLLTAGAVDAVAGAWERGAGVPLVVDPVLASSGGVPLLDADAVRTLVRRLLPLAALVTPNTVEAAALANVPVRDVADAAVAAQALLDLGAAAVLVKGGHLPGSTVTDVLVERGRPPVVFERARVVTAGRVHGTGCALSAAIAAGVARGMPVRDAIELAGRFVHEAIRNAYAIGAGALVLDLSVRVEGMPS